MIRTLFVSSQLVLMHASDMLDQRIIQKGEFAPAYSLSNIQNTILDIIELVRMTLEEKKVEIKFSFKEGAVSPNQSLSFDVRRL